MYRKVFTIVSAFLLMTLPAKAQHGGGGGHGSAFGGGHAMSGHAIGSSIGHSVGHWFGGRSGARGRSGGRGSGQVPPLAGAAMVHGHIVQLPGPMRGVRPITPRRPLTVFGFRPRNGFLLGFGDLGLCSPFESFLSGYGFGNDWGCAQGDYFFDPFFGSGYSPDFTAAQPSNEDMQAAAGGADAPESAELHPDVIVEEEPAAPVDTAPHHQRSPHEPDAILQLRDGTMYGLRDYWLADDRLYYLTNYGGRNSVPLSQIDFEKTQRLNADRGEKLAISQPAPN
jgi:hypothetical protein